MNITPMLKEFLDINVDQNKPQSVSEKDMWSETLDQFEFDRVETEEYVKKKNLENVVAPNPELLYLEKTVFPLLKKAIVATLLKVKQDDSFYHRKTALDGLDYLSEYLYNMNPKHPDREQKWSYIFDMPWVVDHLKTKPRPRFPAHLIWSREFATLKIQSYMRGHWVRCIPEVQELRQFWKILQNEKRYEDLYNVTDF